jgi:hypothetical protein
MSFSTSPQMVMKDLQERLAMKYCHLWGDPHALNNDEKAKRGSPLNQ